MGCIKLVPFWNAVTVVWAKHHALYSHHCGRVFSRGYPLPRVYADHNVWSKLNSLFHLVFIVQAKRYAESLENAIWTNQFDNTANLRAHYETTGPEIWEQTGDLKHP